MTAQSCQIGTVGFDLSTGTVSAGAVNIVSRSGSNQYHSRVSPIFGTGGPRAFQLAARLTF